MIQELVSFLKALSSKDELERKDINKLIAYMKPLMINATDRNVIIHDIYIFYFNKLLKLNNIKIQNDVLTKELIMGRGIKSLSTIGGMISSGLIVFSYIYPDIISRNAGSVAMGASTMLSRVNTLVNVGYGEELDNDLRTGSVCGYPTDEVRGKPSGYTNSETWAKSNLRSSFTDLGSRSENHEQSSFTNLRSTIQEEYINQCSCDFVNEEMGILNRKGGKFLVRLYGNNEEFREEIVNFVRDKTELDFELILGKRCKTNTLNTLGNKYLEECIISKDNTKDLIEIMVKHYPAK